MLATAAGLRYGGTIVNSKLWLLAVEQGDRIIGTFSNFAALGTANNKFMATIRPNKAYWGNDILPAGADHLSRNPKFN